MFVYRFDSDKTLHAITGEPDRHLLNSNCIYLLECKTELYVWIGSHVPEYMLKAAINHTKLLKAHITLSRSIPFGIYTEREHDETTLFKQYFGNWNFLGTDSNKVLEVKQVTNIKSKDLEWKVYDRGSNTPKLQAIDIAHMYDSPNSHPFINEALDKNLDGIDLDPESLIKLDWGFKSLKIWSVRDIGEKSHSTGGIVSISPDSLKTASISFDQQRPFFLRSNECFIFLYEYNEKPSNLRDSILAERSNMSVEELFQSMKQQYVIYTWIGERSNVLDQSLIFHIVREIEKSVKRLNGLAIRGRHIRVAEGKESDHFMNMILGRTCPQDVPEKLKSALRHTVENPPAPVFFTARPSDEPDYLMMYRVSSTNSHQVKIFEMSDPKFDLLCSGFCYVVICESKIYVWKGFGSLQSEQAAGLTFVNNVLKRLPNMDNYTVKIMEESGSQGDFSKLFGSLSESAARSNEFFWIQKPTIADYATRLWKIHHFLNGNPTAAEIESFSQQDLDNNHVYILDAYFKVIVWVGSHVARCDEKTFVSEFDKDTVKSGFKELRLAIKTATHCLEYLIAKGRKISGDDFLVMQSGHEAPFFKSQFPSWDSEIIIPCDWPSLLSLGEATAMIEETKYPLETLKEFSATKQAPFGVDLQHLENYLTETDFIHVFGLEPHLFRKLADWRQAEHKKTVGMF